jgi:hypothetical protein
LVIRVMIERLCPLIGSAVVGSGEAVRFEGWLGLLGVLAQLAETAAAESDHLSAD